MSIVSSGDTVNVACNGWIRSEQVQRAGVAGSRPIDIA